MTYSVVSDGMGAKDVVLSRQTAKSHRQKAWRRLAVKQAVVSDEGASKAAKPAARACIGKRTVLLC